MKLVICPGIHARDLTQSFLTGLQCEPGEKARSSVSTGSQTRLFTDDANFNLRDNLLIFPTHQLPAVSAFHILQMLGEHFPNPRLTSPLVFIGFSAGVVGAIGAAWGWQLSGGSVKALIALDGWGVPLVGFPIYRLSHDYFTHWSSSVLGSGQDSFYADPPVPHLELWRLPQTIAGWQVNSVKETRSYTTAAAFITMLLKHYGEC